MKAFCAQAPSMPPEPVQPLTAEAPSQRQPMTSFWELHSAKGNSSSSKPHPLLALAHESSASCFRPRPCALHRAKRGRAAPGSLGPAALLVVSSARNPIPTGSPSWGSRIGRSKAFFALPPAMPPEPAGPLSAEAPSQRGPKASFGELNSAKGHSPWAANHSLAVTPRRISTQALFTPGPPLSIGQSGAGLPLAPWALLLCWGSLAPETHSPRVLLRGQAGLGARRPSAPWAQPCPLNQLGRSALRSPRNGDPKRASWSCILQRETLLGQQTTAPTRLHSGKPRYPFSTPAHRSP